MRPAAAPIAPPSSAGPHPWRGCRLAIGAILAAALAAGGCGGERNARPPSAASSVDLLAGIESARVTTPEGQSDYVAAWDQEVAGESRPVLFMHPPSRVEFPPIRMSLDSRLELSFGVNEKVWAEAGDGVDFSVSAAVAGGPEQRLVSVYVDPKSQPTDRRWFDVVVTLGSYAGQDVSLILETGPGPSGNVDFDWAGWSRAVFLSDATPPGPARQP